MEIDPKPSVPWKMYKYLPTLDPESITVPVFWDGCHEVINPSDIEYTILCAGCSFTHCRTSPWPHKKTLGRIRAKWYKLDPVAQFIKTEHPYASLLPGHTYNIGDRGSGIRSKSFRKFFEKKPDIKLTHVVYQVPCPSRQPADLNNYDEQYFYATIRKGSLKKAGQARRLAKNLQSVWMQIAVNSDHVNASLQAFDKIDQYLKKAMDMIDINVKLIREKQPNAKIIFLRYEHTLKPLIYEFSKKFYKNMLTDYCKENNITYIYEENFNTKWFKKNKYGSHPNKDGAQLMADKIKEYL